MYGVHTLPVPRMNEMRFLQMGSKIMMMLKLMGSAGPRANARASCMGGHMSVNYSISQYITVNYTN